MAQYYDIKKKTTMREDGRIYVTRIILPDNIHNNGFTDLYLSVDEIANLIESRWYLLEMVDDVPRTLEDVNALHIGTLTLVAYIYMETKFGLRVESRCDNGLPYRCAYISNPSVKLYYHGGYDYIEQIEYEPQD